MTKLNIDLSQVKEFDLLPKGKYPAIVEELELRESQNGNQYLNWKFAFTEGDNEGRVQYMMTSLKPKALFRAKAVFVALGIKEPTFDIEVDDDTNVVTNPQLIGTPCIIDLGIEVYEGQKRNYIVSILPMFSEGETSEQGAPVTPGRTLS